MEWLCSVATHDGGGCGTSVDRFVNVVALPPPPPQKPPPTSTSPPPLPPPPPSSINNIIHLESTSGFACIVSTRPGRRRLISRARFLDKDEDRLKRSNAFDNGIVSFTGAPTSFEGMGRGMVTATAKYLPRSHRISAKKENDDDEDNNTQNSSRDRQNNIKLYIYLCVYYVICIHYLYESIFYFI